MSKRQQEGQCYNDNMSDNQPDGQSRKGKMKRRTADWEEAKVEMAQELGLWDKVQSEGWAALTAAESGRLGGALSRRYPGKAPKRPPRS